MIISYSNQLINDIRYFDLNNYVHLNQAVSCSHCERCMVRGLWIGGSITR